MRTIATALAALALGAAPLAAQPGPGAPPSVRLGLLAGVNSSTLSGLDEAADLQGVDATTRRRIGLLAGGYAVVPLGAGGFAFRPELLYSSKGVTQSVAISVLGLAARPAPAGAPAPSGPRPVVAQVDEIDVDVHVKLDYLELPLLFQFAPAASGGVRPQLYAGPALALRVRCRVTAESGGSSESQGCNAPDGEGDNLFKRFDAGGLVGGAVAVDVGGRAITLGARYTHGLTNVSDVAGSGTQRNRTVGVYGSVEFPAGRPAR